MAPPWYGRDSLDCPEPFSVFGLGASLSSAMTISFVVEEPEIEPITGAQSIRTRSSSRRSPVHHKTERARDDRGVANAAEFAASNRKHAASSGILEENQVLEPS